MTTTSCSWPEAREAGKTTLLSALAAATGAAIVSNDRVVTTRRGGAWQIRGVPTLVRIRAGTRELVPQLGSYWAPVDAQPAMFTLAELEQRPLAPAAAATSLFLSLAQLAKAVDAPLVSGGRLRRIAFVSRDADVQGFELRTVDDPAARTAASVFGLGTERRPATLFERIVGGRTAPVSIDAASEARRLGREVPCVEVVVGREVFSEAPVARALFGALFDDG